MNWLKDIAAKADKMHRDAEKDKKRRRVLFAKEVRNVWPMVARLLDDVGTVLYGGQSLLSWGEKFYIKESEEFDQYSWTLYKADGSLGEISDSLWREQTKKAEPATTFFFGTERRRWKYSYSGYNRA